MPPIYACPGSSMGAQFKLHNAHSPPENTPLSWKENYIIASTAFRKNLKVWNIEKRRKKELSTVFHQAPSIVSQLRKIIYRWRGEVTANRVVWKLRWHPCGRGAGGDRMQAREGGRKSAGKGLLVFNVPGTLWYSIRHLDYSWSLVRGPKCVNTQLAPLFGPSIADLTYFSIQTCHFLIFIVNNSFLLFLFIYIIIYNEDLWWRCNHRSIVLKLSAANGGSY